MSNEQGRGWKGSGRSSSPSIGSTSGSGSKAMSNEVMRSKGTRQLPYQEYIKRRDEGRCFCCGDPFVSGHRCPENFLRVMILGEDEQGVVDSENMLEVSDEENAQPEEVVAKELQELELSLCSAGGIVQPRTMKLFGFIRGEKVRVLVDSGASHNFVAGDVVNQLNLSVSSTNAHSVKLGDGFQKHTQGCCRNLELQLGGHTFRSDFFVFDLGGVDIILGVAWLATLGSVMANWATSSMTFIHKGQVVKLEGDPQLTSSQISSKSLQKLVDIDYTALLQFFLMKKEIEELENTELEDKLEEQKEIELQEVLHKFSKVFSTPKGLPPCREVDHKIPLEVGTDPINVRPYRYPHVQKNEIEKWWLRCWNLELFSQVLALLF